MKPKKHHIRMFMLCCASTNYIWNFDVYTGKENYLYVTKADIVVKGLMNVNSRESSRHAPQDVPVLVDKSAANAYSTLYVDNWYTTPDLMDTLWATYNM
jgi:hypothetical protein